MLQPETIFAALMLVKAEAEALVTTLLKKSSVLLWYRHVQYLIPEKSACKRRVVMAETVILLRRIWIPTFFKRNRRIIEDGMKSYGQSLTHFRLAKVLATCAAITKPAWLEKNNGLGRTARNFRVRRLYTLVNLCRR